MLYFKKCGDISIERPLYQACSFNLETSSNLVNISHLFITVFSDMTFTHEGNKTYFDGLVNFEKMVSGDKLEISVILLCQILEFCPQGTY
jgi:hypothetical protein